MSHLFPEKTASLAKSQYNHQTKAGPLQNRGAARGVVFADKEDGRAATETQPYVPLTKESERENLVAGLKIYS